MNKWLNKLLFGNSTSANNGSAAVGGDNYGSININNGLMDSQYKEITAGINKIDLQLIRATSFLVPNDTAIREAVDQQLDADIDSIAKLITMRKPVTALYLLEDLYGRVTATASGRIRFRIKANIGICHYFLGNDSKTAELLLDAFIQAPSEPKAIANKMLALLLQGHWETAFDFGSQELEKDPMNDVLAGYLIQAARFIDKIREPLKLIPASLLEKPAVIVGYIHFLKQRGKSDEWWHVAHEGEKKFPADEHISRYSAEATVDEVFQDPEVQLTHGISEAQRERLITASNVLARPLGENLVGETKLRPEDKANISNLLAVYLLLRDKQAIKYAGEQVFAMNSNDTELMEIIAHAAIQSEQIELAAKALAQADQTPFVRFLSFQVHTLTGNSESLAVISQ